MYPSKFFIQIGRLLAVSAVVTLTACWKPAKEDKNRDPHVGDRLSETSATFMVTSAGGEAVRPRVTDGKWKLPTHKEIFFWACLQDRMVRERVVGHKFSVIAEESGREFNAEVSDKNGCIKWSETIPYNYLAYRPSYVEVRRKIKGIGVHTGVRQLRLAINPWADERGGRLQDAVIYLDNAHGQVSKTQVVSVEQAEVALRGELVKTANRLWVNDVSPLITQVDEVGEGVVLEVQLKMRPRIQVEDLFGQQFGLDLKNGEFRVYAQLVAANVGEARNEHIILTPRQAPGFGKIIDQQLEASSQVVMSRQVKRGRLELALKVVPVDTPVNLAPFEGIYVLGELERVVGAQAARLKKEMYQPEGEFSYAKYLESASNFDALKKAYQAYDMKPYILETAKVMFAGIQPGETATQRTVEYQVEVCVRDNLTGRRLEFFRFDVIDESGKVLRYKNSKGELAPTVTNDQGCLIWTSSLNHKYYEPEEYFFPKFRVRALHGGFNEEKTLVLNPWDAMFRTFGWDKVQFTDEFIENVQKRRKTESRLFVPSFGYHTIRFQYSIDRFMNLQVDKMILLSINPKVLRYSGIIGGRKVTEDLRDGIYLMKVAIQKDYLDPADKGIEIYGDELTTDGRRRTRMKSSVNVQPKHFVTVADKLVRVNAGQINTPVTFSVQDLRLMRIRSQFLIQLEPIDERLLQAANVMTKMAGVQMKTLADLRRKKTNKEEIDARAESVRSEIEELLRQMKERKTLYQKQVDLSGLPVPAALKTRLQELENNIQEALALNDFTVTPAAPDFDINQLIEKDSGLKRRTFIGPVIFLSNAYSDDLRPTDNLDEKFCVVADCSQTRTWEVANKADNSFYNSSRYYGSVEHFANGTDGKGVQVDDLMKVYREERKAYEEAMPILTSVANFGRFYNLDFVSLKDEALTKFDSQCRKEKLSDCVVPTSEGSTKVADFLRKVNSDAKAQELRRNIGQSILAPVYWQRMGLDSEVSLADLRGIINERKISQNLAARLCGLIAGRMPNLGLGFGMNPPSATYRACFQRAVMGREQEAFSIEPKIRVMDTGGYTFRGGKQLNLNVGTSFSLQRSQSVSFGVGVNFADMIPMVGGVGKAAGALAGAPLSAASLARMDFASSAVKPLSIKYGTDFSRSKSDGTSFSEQTYLVGQIAGFDLELTKYERCAIVKLHPSVMRRASESLPLGMLRDDAREDAGRNLHRGIFLCSGAVETAPLPITETYYYFTQHFTEGDMLDQADLYNHPWLLALRGERDFVTFVHLLKAQERVGANPWRPVVIRSGQPLEKMVEAYRAFLPSFAGMYTPLNEGEALPDYPFTHKAEESFFDGAALGLPER